MSNNSSLNGHAFEYIAFVRLNEAIGAKRKTRAEQDSSYRNAAQAWENVPADRQKEMDESAKRLSLALFELEPMIEEDEGDELIVQLQPDAKGQLGDVRDILLTRKEADWEIGLSLKHNHFAVKHSRLGTKLDFGQKWCGLPCSSEYWEAIAPIFERLTQLKKAGKRWNEVENKDTSVYVPLLEAFCKEIRRCAQEVRDFPQKIVSYMIGELDFYKVVSVRRESAVKIMGININGTLNRPSKKQKPRERIARMKLPTRLVDIAFQRDSTNTIEMIFDAGWQFSLRIHNASSRVEPSLKFDIQLVGTPTSISQMTYYWLRKSES